MPFISDSQLARVQSAVARTHDRAIRAKKKAEEKAGQMKTVAEIMGGAGLVGFVRGKMEDKASGAWNIPGTTIDMELAAGLGLTGAAFFEVFGKYDEDALNVGAGILAHYAGQIARHWGKTGSFGLVAGRRPGQLVGASGNAQDALRSALAAI